MAILYLLLTVVFSLNGLLSLDPDLGWHLQMGQLILQSGIPTHDPFSYTMPSFHFIDHEWLTNVVLYFIYSHVGIIPLAFLFGAIGSLTIWVLCANRSKQLTIGFICLTTSVLIYFTGIRPQLLSSLFLAVLMVVLESNQLYPKWKWLIPGLFLVWTNLHGGFAAGILCLFIWQIAKTLRTRIFSASDWLISLSSLVVTFINPYRQDLWLEIWRTTTDTALRGVIQEWQPGLLSWNMVYFFLITISLSLIAKYRHHFKLEELAVFGVFLTLSLASQRHIPLWVVISLPLVFKGLAAFEQQINQKPQAKERFAKVLTVFNQSCLVVLIISVMIDLIGAINLSQNNFYPVKAVNYLQTHPRAGQLMSSYNWGGYLIWKLPDQKVFIDGRMPSWKQSHQPSQESNAMNSYLKLISQPSDLSLLSKYNVTTVLWTSPGYTVGQQIPFLSQLQVSFSHLLGQPKKVFSFNQELLKQDWKVIYEDHVATVYQKL